MADDLTVVRPPSEEYGDGYLAEVKRRRRQSLATISRLPIAILIWGPAPTAGSPIATTRVALRDTLRSNGHVANFSEELYEPDEQYSIQAQQAADVEAHDIVFSLPDSPGSIAELHDFFKLPGLARKIVTFLDEQWNDGYANKSLVEIRSLATGDIITYEACNLPQFVVSCATDIVRRLQEVHYLLGRRA